MSSVLKFAYGFFVAFLAGWAVGATADVWPDGTPIGPWFGAAQPVDVAALGKAYRFDLNCIFPDGETHTRDIQALIDRAATEGGGVITVTPGVYRTGSLFFRPKVHLHLMEGAVLFGSDNPLDYPIVETRIEGTNQKFVAALVNAEGCDGFTIVGPGMIDGNGYRSWRSSVLRHTWCPTAVNLDDQRARLLYVARSKDVRLENVRFQNPQFWTQHFWQCENVRLEGVTVYSPRGPEGHVKSCTDALDLDETRNVVVRNCRFGNYDDAVSLKGCAGPAVENILIEDTEFGFCHGALVLGSELKRARNVLMRRCRLDQAMRVLWIKFRADMPQHYDYLTVEDVSGTAEWFFFARQFSDNRDLKGLPSGVKREEMLSRANHFNLRNCKIDCRFFFHMTVEPPYVTLEASGDRDKTIIEGHVSTLKGNSNGCWSNAMRCVCLNTGSVVKGFTLIDGRTCNKAGRGDTADTCGGAVYGAGQGLIVDSLISNCGSSDRGPNVYESATLLRCRVETCSCGNFDFYMGAKAIDSLICGNKTAYRNCEFVNCTFPGGYLIYGNGTNEKGILRNCLHYYVSSSSYLNQYAYVYNSYFCSSWTTADTAVKDEFSRFNVPAGEMGHNQTTYRPKSSFAGIGKGDLAMYLATTNGWPTTMRRQFTMKDMYGTDRLNGGALDLGAIQHGNNGFAIFFR